MEEKLLMSWEETGKKDTNPAAIQAWAIGTETIFLYVMMLSLY